jgi:glycosyltransferase involved in cell wall biosynthesis
MNLKVVHVITTVMRGGAENQLVELVQKQVELGANVGVIYLKGAPELKSVLEFVGAQVFEDIANRNPIVQIIKLRKLVSSENHILHGHLPRAELICAIAKGKSKFFFTRHNAESFFPGTPKWLGVGLSRFVSNRAISGIAITKAVHDYAVESKEIPTNYSMYVVHYGYSRKATKAIKDTNKQFLVQEKSRPLRVVTVGRLVAQKDQQTLIKAVRKLLDQGHDVHLTIIGDGILNSELKELSEELGVASNVRFLGRIQDPLSRLHDFDVFVLPSIYEGFGMVLLEAMDCGLPIIGADNTCIPEVIGEAGILFKTGSSLDLSEKIKIMFDVENRKHYSELSSRRLNEFDPIRMATSIIGIYRLENG